MSLPLIKCNIWIVKGSLNFTFAQNGPMEMLTVGSDSAWTELSYPSGSLLKYGVSINNQIYMHGKATLYISNKNKKVLIFTI